MIFLNEMCCVGKRMKGMFIFMGRQFRIQPKLGTQSIVLEQLIEAKKNQNYSFGYGNV